MPDDAAYLDYTARLAAELEPSPVLRCLRCLLDLEDDPRPARTVWSGDALCSRHLSERLALYGLNVDLEDHHG